MNAVERIMYYCEHMEQEESVQLGSDGKKDRIVSSSLIRNDKKDGDDDDMTATRMEKIDLHHRFSTLLKEEEERYKDWPSEGAIEFRDVRMSYHTGPLVLKGISKCVFFLLFVSCSTPSIPKPGACNAFISMKIKFILLSEFI